MGILYAWATKEYLLEKMSFGQIIMYLNYGMDFKYPKVGTGKVKKPSEMTAKELRAERAKLRKQFGTNIEGL